MNHDTYKADERGDGTADTPQAYTVENVTPHVDLVVWPDAEDGKWINHDDRRHWDATPREVALALRMRSMELDYQATIARLVGERDKACAFAKEWLRAAQQARGHIFGPRDEVDYEAGLLAINAIKGDPHD